MGIQTVTVTRVGGLRVFTTYVTGTLAKCSESVAAYALWFHDRTRGRLARRLGRVLAVTPRTRHARAAALTFSLWLGFLAGAVSGTSGAKRYGFAALALPIVVLAAITGIDLVWPVAADEPVERDSAH